MTAAAGRADKALTSLRDRRLKREAQLRRRNITLTTAGVAVDPGKLTIAVVIGEGHRFVYVSHKRSDGPLREICCSDVESGERTRSLLCSGAKVT
jgi:hypothetical protein